MVGGRLMSAFAVACPQKPNSRAPSALGYDDEPGVFRLARGMSQPGAIALKYARSNDRALRNEADGKMGNLSNRPNAAESVLRNEQS